MHQRLSNLSCFIWAIAAVFLCCLLYSVYLPLNSTNLRWLHMLPLHASPSISPPTQHTATNHNTTKRPNSTTNHHTSKRPNSTTNHHTTRRPNSTSNGPTTTCAASPTSRVLLANKNCTSPWTSIVYPKTHKTGSTTLQTIVNRFGFFHNLSFVFNKKSSRNGHFYEIPIGSESPKEHFLPPLKVKYSDYNKYKFDMLAVHVRYNKKKMDLYMKNGAKYITIIREPGAQWESAFDQFIFQEAFKNASAIPQDKWIETFLEKPEYYRDRLKTMRFEGKIGRRYYYSQNSQMYDLGLDIQHFKNETIINATILRLEREFALILITEYFDESLVVLKKELCWDYKDIVYNNKNSRVNRQNLTDEIRQKVLYWNHADVLLYDYFNKTLWRKVDEYGPTFAEDLEYFRELNRNVSEECVNATVHYKRVGTKRTYKHVVYLPKKNSSLFCHTVAEEKAVLFKRVYERQNQFKPKPKPDARTHAHRRPQPRANTRSGAKPRPRKTLPHAQANPPLKD